MKRIYLLLLCLSVCVLTINAQTKQISGTITSEDDGTAITGATVAIPGTTVGVISDYDGNYKISGIPADAEKISFSFVGMKTLIVDIAGQSIINVALESDLVGIDEVMVVAYGTTTKEAYTGSATKISSSEISERPVSSFQDVLKGNSPGTISTGTGRPGALSTIRLRGVGSMNASNAPLYVIDGIVWDGSNLTGSSDFPINPLSTLNPSDIESMTVLKDAASASLYGSRGANGVIIITTKQGKRSADGKPQITVDVQMGFSQMAKFDQLDGVNKDEFVELWLEAEMHSLVMSQTGSSNLYDELISLYADKQGYTIDGKNYNDWYDAAKANWKEHFGIMNPETGEYYDYDYLGADYDKMPDNDWYNDVITQDGPFQKINFSMRSASDYVKQYTSLEYYNEEGLLKGSYLKRYSARYNMSSEVDGALFHGGLNTLIASTQSEGDTETGGDWMMPNYTASLLAPVAPVYLSDGSYNYNLPGGINSNNNPMAVIELNEYSTPSMKAVVSGWLKVNPTSWLSVKSQVGINYTYQRRRQVESSEFGDGASTNGKVLEREARKRRITNTNVLSASQTFNDVHSLSFIAGTEFEDVRSEYFTVTGINFATNDTPYLSAASETSSMGGSGSEFAMFSLLSKLDYSYDRKYFFSASIRQDQSSRFAPENRTGTFWSGSGAWSVSKESFMSSVGFIDNLKLKSSYGVQGTLPSSYYEWQNTYAFGADYMGAPGANPSKIANRLLTWEDNMIWNIGIDATLLNKIDLTFEYYNRKSSNILMDMPISSTTGYTEVLKNVEDAGLKNRGFEFTANIDFLDKNDWHVGANMSLAYLANEYFGLESDIVVKPSGMRGVYLRRNGYSEYTWYMAEWAGVDKATGQSTWYVVNDNGDKEITYTYSDATKQVMGKGIAPYTGSFAPVVSYKGIELSALFTFAYGKDFNVWDHEGYNSTKNDGYRDVANMERSQLDRWTPDNTDGTNVLRINEGNKRYEDTRYMHNGDYLKLNNVKLQYGLPKAIVEKLKMASIRVFAQGENLWVATELKGYDPDIAIGGARVRGLYPSSSKYTGGVQFNF